MFSLAEHLTPIFLHPWQYLWQVEVTGAPAFHRQGSVVCLVCESRSRSSLLPVSKDSLLTRQPSLVFGVGCSQAKHYVSSDKILSCQILNFPCLLFPFTAPFPEGVSPQKDCCFSDCSLSPMCIPKSLPCDSALFHQDFFFFQYFLPQKMGHFIFLGKTLALLSPRLSSEWFFLDLLCSPQRTEVSELHLSLLERDICLLLTRAGSLKFAVLSVVQVVMRVWGL